MRNRSRTGRRLLFDTRDLETASQEMLEDISGAVLQAAYKVRNDARDVFTASRSIYKNSTSRYNPLKEGIMVGKLRDVSGDASVKVHSLGARGGNTWKARFFTGGTIQRRSDRRGSKPYTKGYIKENDSLERSVASNSQTLENFITKLL